MLWICNMGYYARLPKRTSNASQTHSQQIVSITPLVILFTPYSFILYYLTKSYKVLLTFLKWQVAPKRLRGA
jgi:hypothetical protein